MSPRGQNSAAMVNSRQPRRQRDRRGGASQSTRSDTQGRTSEEVQGVEETVETLTTGREVVPFCQSMVPVPRNGMTIHEPVQPNGEGSSTDTGMEYVHGVDGAMVASVVQGESGVVRAEAVTVVAEVHPQMTPPQGRPQSFGPLFTPEQLSQMDALSQQAPMLRSRDEYLPLQDTPGVETVVEAQQPPPGMTSWWNWGLGMSQRMPEDSWRLQVQRDMENMGLMLRAAQHENDRLRRELRSAREADVRAFETPGNSQAGEDGAPSREGARQAEDGAPSREGAQQGEDGPRGQQGREEDGAPSREGAQQGRQEDGPRGRQEREEDGAPSREGVRQAEDGPRGQQEQGRSRGDHHQGQEGGQSTRKQEMEFMVLMLQSMQELQRKMSEDRDGRDGIEVVRTGAPDLPVLSEWTPTEGPIAMGDWLTLLEPAMADLSESSEEWWSELMQAVQSWYSEHVLLSPLERAGHKPVPPPHLQQRKWQRLERRVASMLLKAIPEAQKEELVAGKNLGAFAIMAHLQILYQPGGLGEKEIIIRNLESPPEATSLQDAVIQLRRWIRWRIRAKDIGVSEPDPSVLVRGLGKISRKVLDTYGDLRFRISLARSTLMLDSAPTAASVERYVTVLLAEVEQIVHIEKGERKTIPKPKLNEARVKDGKGDSERGEKGGKGKSKGGEGKGPLCHYFLTEEGCRKGRDCGFAHVMDQEKRCYACGSKSHFANSCPRSSGEAKDGHQKALKSLQKSPEKDIKNSGPVMAPGGEKGGESGESITNSSASSVQGLALPDDGVKSLLEEAHRMLKSITVDKESIASTNKGEERISSLQKQLDGLKKVGLRVFRLSRLQKTDDGWGLLDSGATHPLRPPHPHEDLSLLPDVSVILAGGQEVAMKIGKGGSIIGKADTEPIVPMGLLASALKCKLLWNGDGMKLIHPHRGSVPIKVIDGCPMVERGMALELIKELEENQWQKAHLAAMRASDLGWKKAWIEKLAEEHPAFRGLPKNIKEALKVEPCEYIKPMGNRRRRKLWKREGMILHLFAGPDEGYTLRRALKEIGGDQRRLHEIDVLRGGPQNDFGPNGMAYAQCLHLALEGQIEGVLAGPPCRTRSVLRHYEVEGIPNMPRPVRCWDGGEFGMEGLSSFERQMVEEDDILMFRAWMVWIIAEEMRKAEGKEEMTKFGMEQPAVPEKQEVVTIWKTSQWKNFESAYGFGRQSFYQGDFGGAAKKPTSWGGNLPIELPRHRGFGTKREVAGKTKEEILLEARKLSRWAPGMMRAVAIQVQEVVFGKRAMLKKMTWQQHLNGNHFPFRKDCRVCQEACARDGPHRRSKLPPRAGVLSVDMAGPFVSAPDLHRGAKARYFLAATFTWPDVNQDGKPEEEFQDPGCPEESPWIEAEEVVIDPKEKKRGRPSKEVIAARKRAAEEEEIKRLVDEIQKPTEEPDQEKGYVDEDRLQDMEFTPRPDLDVEYEPSILEESPEGEKEERKDPKIKFFRFVTPLESRDKGKVMKAIVDIYLRLRSAGMEVQQIHSDNAGEFTSNALSQWCMQRGVLQTYTAGDQPQSNGRAEQSVAELKSRIRRMLLAANCGADHWALAARCLSETLWIEALGHDRKCPPFMSDVLVRKRQWKSEEFLPIQEKVKYIAPSWVKHGHWVEYPNGSRALTRLTMSELQEPPQDHHWIAIEHDPGHFEARWRIRQKASLQELHVRTGEAEEDHEAQEEEKHEEDERMKRAWRVLEEEMTLAVTEGEDSIDVILDSLAQFRQLMVTEEEEILQTKIVSTGEVRRNLEAWTPAILAELEALCTRKEALEEIGEEEGKRLVHQGKAEVIPAKLVCTVKPDPASRAGKRKIRIVGCGNHVEPDPDQDLFAAGTNAVAVRIALALSSQHRWMGRVLDIRTAFLNAPMEADQDGSEAGEEGEVKMALMKPPSLLVQTGFIKPGRWWRAKKAVYGYRQSPKRWSDHRDSTIRKKKIKLESGGVIVLRQMVSEPGMWMIVEEDSQGNEIIRGVMLIYVDDLLICGDQDAVNLVTQCIEQTWEVSTPEDVGHSQPTRFLGMELWKKEDGSWFASQVAYTTDLLRRRLGEDQSSWPTRKVPLGKDPEEEVEVEKTPEDVKRAQKCVGELVWLSTRCRPDLMFVVAKMASGITRWPKAVELMAKQVWFYLAGTIHHGLTFGNVDDERTLNVYADASFGQVCHGCTLVQWGTSPLLWKSSKQAVLSSSTAEAELIELLESVNAGEAIRVVVEELLGEECRAKAHSDSTAALAISIGESGSWKTRHLRRKAQSMRWRVTKGDWVARHIPGAENPADLGTKALSSEKFERFKRAIGMGLFIEESHAEDWKVVDAPLRYQQEHQPQANAPDQGTLQRALAAVVMAARLSIARSENESGEEVREGGGPTLIDFVIFWVVIPAILTISFVLWNQRNEARRKLKQKEDEEKEQKKERDIHERIQRQVSEEVKKMKEEESMARSSAAGSERLSRRLRRNQSDESALSSVSPVAKVSEARSESSVGVNDAHCPRLSFPEGIVGLYVSPGGAKYHFNPNCRGLRNATESRNIPRCRNCGPVQVKPRVTLYGNYRGEMHTIKGHAAVVGEHTHYEPCHICTGA